MTVPLRTYGFLGFAVTLLAAGYLFVPSPSATPLPQPVAKAAPAGVPAATPKPATTLVANRAPVPLVTTAHTRFFDAPPEQPAPATAETPTSEAQLQLAVAEPKSGDDSKAKAAIELDGYRNVRGLMKDADGVWRGRAMRGRTEIAIRVNADGSVSQD